MDYIKYVLFSVGIVLLTITAIVSYKSISALQSVSARLDRANVEYQFVVTDSTITVWDHNRPVGTVRLEGQLDSLIIADNQ
jgi:hypothetical protein